MAYWGQRTLNDTQRYVDTVQPLVDSPEVQDVLATTVTDAIQKQVDVESILNNVFASVITDRPRLQQLVGPLSAAINGLIERQVREFFASDAFADIWVRANTRAQQALHRLLEGDETGAVSLQGDEVVLDVAEVIDQVKQRLVDRGLTFVENAPIPDSRPADRAARGTAAQAAAHDLRLRQPGGEVGAAVRRRCCTCCRSSWPDARARMTVAVGACRRGQRRVHRDRRCRWGGTLFDNQLAGTPFGPASKVFYETMLAYLQRGQTGRALPGPLPGRRGLVRRSNRYGTAVRGGVT